MTSGRQFAGLGSNAPVASESALMVAICVSRMLPIDAVGTPPAVWMPYLSNASLIAIGFVCPGSGLVQSRVEDPIWAPSAWQIPGSTWVYGATANSSAPAGALGFAILPLPVMDWVRSV